MRVVTLTCVLVVAASANAAADWSYASSDHFEVYAAGGDRQARDALSYIERVHAFFTQYLRLTPLAGPRTRVIIFSSGREFAPYRPNDVTAAFYLSGPDRDHIVMGSFDEDANRIVVHEYAHLIIRRSGAVYPLWLNEGLAEFFSTLVHERGRMKVGIVPEDRLRYLNDGVTMLPLERLFAIDARAPEYNTAEHAGVFYSQSWALTHLVLADDRYRGKSGDFLQRVIGGTSSADALAAVYGKTSAAVRVDLNNYVRRGYYTYFFTDYTAPSVADAPPTRRPDAFEVDLMTTNLLANMINRQNDARAAFERLAAQRPGDLSVAESRANFELRHGLREAVPYFARAVELGSRNVSLLRDYARIEPSRAEDLLAQAMALAPDDAQVALAYGRVLLSKRKIEEALTVLAAVKRVPRESAFDLFQLQANARLQRGELPEAREAATRAVQYASPGPEADFAGRLLKSIEDAIARWASQSTAARPAVVPSAPPPSGGGTAAPGPSQPASRSSRAPIVIVDGRIINMICGTGSPVVEVATQKGTLRLLIDNPLAITVYGKSGGVTDLACGRQDVPISIGFEAVSDPARKTDGNVRRLDYRP